VTTANNAEAICCCAAYRATWFNKFFSNRVNRFSFVAHYAQTRSQAVARIADHTAPQQTI